MSETQSDFLIQLNTVLSAEQLEQRAEVLLENSRDFGQFVGDPIMPLAVVYPRTVEDVQKVMRLAYEHRMPVVSRGAGTGVSGGVHVTGKCIVLNLMQMNRIVEVRPEDEVAVVEPGVINYDLNVAVSEHGLMYAPDPASYKMSTIGGNIATNAGGLRCAKYGVTRESVLAVDVVLSDGRLVHLGRNTFKGVAGYDLTGLFTGSEGTLGVVVRAVLRLRYLPVDERDISMLFPSLEAAVLGVQRIARARVQPAILELLDLPTIEILDDQYSTNYAAHGGAMLLVRVDGYGAEKEEAVIRETFENQEVTLSDSGADEATTLIEMRRTSRGDTKDDAYRMGEDIAVPKSKMSDYVRELRQIAYSHEVDVRVIAHAGDGNLHPTFSVEPGAGVDPLARLSKALEGSIRLAIEMGGTITGEHGVGLIKRDWLSWEQTADVLLLQQEIKALFDPRNILNPGKAL
ncbi:FAD-binding oxidoreductase [Arthrobacter sp. MYb211]|uniref:FAD-binding oxidoreductase n=3 Tax=Micrococcales TaxID=85006 RepID=UPI000BB7E2CF|nr:MULTISPECIES: FAD-linked oxidase C-terminal domain-containing protein [Micrococcaceae]PCC28364.1 FAD-binding oxidoreductase [Glutamicibacter sp. BW80]PQZ94539.1 FAD-binding oxidoreductase [Arthrobacter sp. MYb224]PRA08164.1 FAD-binding oxidoreductase [Arthrobacter sp. MYb221]PRC02065.1 FAD-binding oxidoreductase [Arthrobacter sp. MYb211]